MDNFELYNENVVAFLDFFSLKILLLFIISYQVVN